MTTEATGKFRLTKEWLAEAIHDNCIRHWQSLDSLVAVTMHGQDAHYEQAADVIEYLQESGEPDA
jgi:hypothetical protein